MMMDSKYLALIGLDLLDDVTTTNNIVRHTVLVVPDAYHPSLQQRTASCLL
jgi:hypothetical protein